MADAVKNFRALSFRTWGSAYYMTEAAKHCGIPSKSVIAFAAYSKKLVDEAKI
jgi:hypothetical protein